MGKKKNNYLATKKKIRFSLLELLFSLLVKSVFNYSSIIIIINLMGLNYKYYKYQKKLNWILKSKREIFYSFFFEE